MVTTNSRRSRTDLGVKIFTFRVNGCHHKVVHEIHLYTKKNNILNYNKIHKRIHEFYTIPSYYNRNIFIYTVINLYCNFINLYDDTETCWGSTYIKISVKDLVT